MKRRSKAGGKAVRGRRTARLKRRRSSPTAAPRYHPTGQDSDTVRLIRERDEALEREKATAEVLRVISLVARRA